MKFSNAALTDPKPPRIRGPHARSAAFARHSPARRVRVLLDELGRLERLCEIADALIDACGDDVGVGALPQYARDAGRSLGELCDALHEHWLAKMARREKAR